MKVDREIEFSAQVPLFRSMGWKNKSYEIYMRNTLIFFALSLLLISLFGYTVWRAFHPD